MHVTRTVIASCLLLAGCGHHYSIVGESDTGKGIAVSIMKVGSGPPVRLYYTELTGNDTEFVYDANVDDKDARVEAWFELKEHPGHHTVYTLPPGRHVRLQLDRKHDQVVVEETKIDGKKHQRDH